ncbi:MAG TPA: hypothetical protein VJU15_05715 [Gemmatimonadales bacterium]|nr:hypothetical protein [Gemmatimonadales bacterium]
MDNEDSLLRPALAGASAGLAGGVVWALIVALINWEIGWIAWGIGWAIAWAMGRVTAQRSTELAGVAAALALMSLLLGKVLIQQFVTGPGVESDLMDPEDRHTRASAWRLDETKGWPATIQSRLDAMSESDTLTDALWNEMRAAADSHSASLSEDDRVTLISQYRTAMLASYGPWEQLRASFSLWDILWAGLAISTAWKMMKGGDLKEAAESA